MSKPLTPEGPGGSIQLRPQATPVDTFIRPVAPGASALGQLASALSSVAPELRQFGAAVSQREAEQSAAQGEAFAADMEHSKEAWAGLVKDGKVAPGQNPHFILAAKRKFGQVAASRFQIALNDSLTKLGDAPTPEQFEQAVSDTRNAFLKENAGAASNDLAFMGGFNGMAEQTIDNARRGFAAQHAKQIEETGARQFTMAMHVAATAALENPDHTDADVAAAINKQAEEWATANPKAAEHTPLTGSQIAKAKVSVLFSLMDQTGNPELIKRLAKQIKSGDATLADDPEFYERYHERADHVTADQRTKEQEQRIADAKAQQDAQDAAKDALLTAFKHGGAIDRAPVVAQLRAAGVKDAEDFVAKVIHDLPELDPTVYIGYRSQVANGKYPSITELTAAANSNKISRTQYDGLLNDIEQAKNAERSLSAAGAPTTESIWSHPAMKALEQQIRAAAETKITRSPFGQILSINGFTEVDVEQAVTEAKIDMAQTLAANWNKYGSGAASVQLASHAWRTYALRHNIINYAESLEGGDGPLPADKTKAKQVTKNRDAIQADIAQRQYQFTDAELSEGRTVLLKWKGMTADQRRAWLATSPRRLPLLQTLMTQATTQADSTSKK